MRFTTFPKVTSVAIPIIYYCISPERLKQILKNIGINSGKYERFNVMSPIVWGLAKIINPIDMTVV